MNLQIFYITFGVFYSQRTSFDPETGFLAAIGKFRWKHYINEFGGTSEFLNGNTLFHLLEETC
jgi:hypothetical protein